MTWNDAVRTTLKEVVGDRRAKVTHISEQAGQQRNFLTRFFSGDKSTIDLDELDSVVRVLGFSDIQPFIELVKKNSILSKSLSMSTN